MTINWEEVIDFITFCDNNSIVLMLIFISGPYHLTLKNLGPVTLSKIAEKLSKTKPATYNTITNYNKFVFENLMTKTKQWQKEAESRQIMDVKYIVHRTMKDYIFRNHKKADEVALDNKFLDNDKRINEIFLSASYSNPDFYKHIIEMPIDVLVSLLEKETANHIIANHIEEHYNQLVAE